MSRRWEGYLAKAEAEAPRIKEHAANAPSAREQAQAAKSQYDNQDQPRSSRGAHS